MVQSYEKTREMQKESSLFFSFPSVSNFGGSQSLRKNERNAKGKHVFSFFV